MRYTPLVLAMSGLLPFPLLAADAVTLDAVVVVGAPRAEAPLGASTALGKAEMPALRASTSDSASLLRDAPGVSLYGAGGVSSLPAIHGLADERVRTLVDGADLIAACPNHMNPALSYIDPTRVERVRVYAGVAPVSVGGDSLAGSIVVESARPRYAKPGAGLLAEGEVGAFYRSNGAARGANARVTLAGENLSIAYAGSTAESDNYQAADAFKTTAATGRAGHALDLDAVGSTAYKAINQALDIGLRGGNHAVDLKLSRQHVPFENFPNQRMDLTGNDSDQVKLGYTGQFQWGVLKARAWREDTEHKMDFGADRRFWYGTASGGPSAVNGSPCSPIGATCAAGMPMDTQVAAKGLALHADLPLAGQDGLRVGAEYHGYRLDDWWPPSGAGMWPGTFWNIRDGERDRLAVFGEWEGRLAPRWTGLFGLRHETVKMNAGAARGYNPSTNGMAPMLNYQMRDADAFNALDHQKADRNLDLTALARFTPDASHAYEFGLARKTRSPSLYERYPWSTWSMAAVMNNFVGDGNGYVGNLDLKPEVAHTLSVAVDWHDAGKQAWSLRVAPYYTHVDDFIDAHCLPGTICTAHKFNVLQYVNQSARLHGVDVSGSLRLASDTGYGDFSLGGVLNYARGENRVSGDNLYNIMPLNAILALTRTHGRWSNTLEARLVAGKDSVSAIRNEIKTDGYALVNLRASYAWKHARVDVGIDNLFDKAYDLPLGGAYLGQGTTMSINTVPWGIAVPGPGRALYAGMSLKF
jgi:iron complex outermembrane receptor protein